MTRKKPRATRNRPVLGPDMSVADFTSYYWMKDDLVRFARRLGLPAHGHKPELGARIERRLRRIPNRDEPKRKSAKGPRDSDRALSRETRVVHYKSVRGFFADPANAGKSLADAAGAWNAIKGGRCSRRYRPRPAEEWAVE